MVLLRCLVALAALSGVVGFSSPVARGVRRGVSMSMQKNGWKYDATKFCGGLPGAIAPLGEFDPLQICMPDQMTESEVKRLREAEVTHCRVAMLAFVGYLVGEAVVPLTGHNFIAPTKISGCANEHLGQFISQAPVLFLLLVLSIGAAEIRRAQIGWISPDEQFFALREDYYPGDVGFDPLGFKPTEPEKFVEEQNKELSNGRLAMIAVAGLCVQELVAPYQILEYDFGFSRNYIGN